MQLANSARSCLILSIEDRAASSWSCKSVSAARAARIPVAAGGFSP
jgi:hypothetical protein